MSVASRLANRPSPTSQKIGLEDRCLQITTARPFSSTIIGRPSSRMSTSTISNAKDKSKSKDKSLYEAMKKQVKLTTEIRKMSLFLPETTGSQDKRSQESPLAWQYDKHLRRMLTSIRHAEYHADRLRHLLTGDPEMLTKITERIEEGDGEDIIRHMVDIVRLGRKLLTPQAVDILAICAAANLPKLPPNRRQNLKLLTYEALPFICETPAELSKFVAQYDTMTADKKGADVAHRKAIQNWYTSKSAWDLARLMSLCEDSSHREMLKKLNPRKTGCGQMEFQYLIMAITLGCQPVESQSPTAPPNKSPLNDNKNGKNNNRRSSEVNSINNAQVNVFTEYIFAAEAVKSVKHSNEAIELIKRHKLELDHIPHTLLYSKDVWKTLLPSMSLQTLLRNISRIASFKLLSLEDIVRFSDSYYCSSYRSFDDSKRRWRDSSVDTAVHSSRSENFLERYKHMAIANDVKDTTEAIQTVLDKLETAELPVESPMSTSFQLLVALAQYSYGRTGREIWSAYFSYWSSYSRNYSYWSVNPTVCRMLEATYSRCVAQVKPTGKRFLILIDCSPSMDCNCLSAFQLTARVFLGVLLQFLVDTEDHCEIHSSLHRVSSKFPYGKGWKADQITSHSGKSGYSVINISEFVEWAEREKIVADVLMVISDDGVDYRGTPPHQLLKSYRTSSGVTDAKLISLQLTSATRKIASNDDLGTLDIHGFDYDTIGLLRAFVMDLI